METIEPRCSVIRNVPAWMALIQLPNGEHILGKVIGEVVQALKVPRYRVLHDAPDGRQVIGLIEATHVEPLAPNVIPFARPCPSGRTRPGAGSEVDRNGTATPGPGAFRQHRMAQALARTR
jgi:hypothetical protein